MRSIDQIISTLDSFSKESFADILSMKICFDAKADSDGRCVHHGGKCYELGLLIEKLRAKSE